MEFPFMWRIYEAGTSTFSDYSTRDFAFRSVLETLDYVVAGKYEYNKYTFLDLTTWSRSKYEKNCQDVNLEMVLKHFVVPLTAIILCCVFPR